MGVGFMTHVDPVTIALVVAPVGSARLRGARVRGGHRRGSVQGRSGEDRHRCARLVHVRQQRLPDERANARRDEGGGEAANEEVAQTGHRWTGRSSGHEGSVEATPPLPWSEAPWSAAERNWHLYSPVFRHLKAFLTPVTERLDRSPDGIEGRCHQMT